MSAPIGSSKRFLEVLADVRAVAPSGCAVLVQGETGTGKEVIARAIHDASSCRSGPFVALNCAAVPAALLESELFGHERGSFTGAIAQTTGRFLAADGGTLFLDEIGDMPLELQPKLLRVLQERMFERIGSTRSIRTNVRVIAATNQNLLTMVDEGRFRADLFYRLSVFPIALPPLRERLEDLEELSHAFLRQFARTHGKNGLTLSMELMDLMRLYSWPGNIRELQNFIERAVIVSDGTTLTPRASEIRRLRESASAPASETLGGAQRLHILQTLEDTDWVLGGRRGAAARLGIPRTTLISKMQRLGIPRPSPVYAAHLGTAGQPGFLEGSQDRKQ
jgi:transcriptional regulator with GAF, ATPase, and Fis domain